MLRITVEISDQSYSRSFDLTTEQFDEFKIGFLRIAPIPLDRNGDPLFSEGDWILKNIRDHLRHLYGVGKEALASDATPDPQKDDTLLRE